MKLTGTNNLSLLIGCCFAIMGRLMSLFFYIRVQMCYGTSKSRVFLLNKSKVAYLILWNSLLTLAAFNAWCTGNVKSRCWVFVAWDDSCFSRSTVFNSCLSSFTWRYILFSWLLLYSIFIVAAAAWQTQQLQNRCCEMLWFLVHYFFLLSVLRKKLFKYTAVFLALGFSSYCKRNHVWPEKHSANPFYTVF